MVSPPAPLLWGGAAVPAAAPAAAPVTAPAAAAVAAPVPTAGVAAAEADGPAVAAAGSTFLPVKLAAVVARNGRDIFWVELADGAAGEVFGAAGSALVPAVF